MQKEEIKKGFWCSLFVCVLWPLRETVEWEACGCDVLWWGRREGEARPGSECLPLKERKGESQAAKHRKRERLKALESNFVAFLFFFSFLLEKSTC